ncbi:MAG TPA: hypothetical protein VEG38_07810 [Acidimicrobiia bacterium]|nr:hypothetical protein [Acidimicrobiia bacterium]
MQISTKQKLLRVAAGSIFAAGAVFIPAAAATAEGEAGRVDIKGPPQLPDMPTDPAEGLPVPIPGHGS